MRRKAIAVFLASMLMSAGVTLFVQTRAEAATCQLSHVCLWQGAAFTGTTTRYGVSNSSGATGCKSLSGDTMNNNAESMVNGSYKFINFYNTTNCTGTILTWLHSTTTSGGVHERSSGASWRNLISSFRYCPNASPCP